MTEEQSSLNEAMITGESRPVYLEDLGLVTVLEMLMRKMESVSDVKVTFQKLVVERRLTAPVELALYRMAQEALNNVARHAMATQAKLVIHFWNTKIEMQINDNGLGFEAPSTPADFAPSGHFGLLGMYERADLIGARLTIHSVSGQGTQLAISYRRLRKME